MQKLGQVIDRVLYRYYNYRKSSATDLLLIAALNIGLIIGGGLLKVQIDTVANPSADVSLWDKVWDVLVLTVFQDVPEEYKSVHTLLQQVFAVAVATVGVAGFALVLALIEQVRGRQEG